MEENKIKQLHKLLRSLLKNEFNMSYYKESNLHIKYHDAGMVKGQIETITYADGWKFIIIHYIPWDGIFEIAVFKRYEKDKELGYRYTAPLRYLDSHYYKKYEDEKIYIESEDK